MAVKVLFSNPPWWEKPEGGWRRKKRWRAGVRAGSRWPFTETIKSSPDDFVFGGYLPYPFFMGYAATYAAEKTGAAVELRDSIALRESYDRYFEHLGRDRYDFIFFESATPSWEHDAGLIERAHRAQPDARIVVTGPITTTQAQEILDTLPVTACIRGEYEKGSVRAISGETGIIDYDLLTEEEMNAAPFPHFDPQCADRYWDANPRGQVAPHAQVWSSRGCPFKCIFCVWPAAMTGNDPDGTGRRTVRHYGKDYMEAMIRELLDRHPFESIYFDDDTFNLGRRHVENMCEVMAPLDVPWTAMCRADTIKLETWKLMRESGCVGVKLGFESGNQYVVDKIVNKHLDLDYGREVVHYLKQLGMSVHGTFTYGLPGETREQMLDTKRFIESLPFDTYQESGTAEIEGTPLHTLRSEGRLGAYEAARLDENYERGVDGSKKYQSLVAGLRED